MAETTTFLGTSGKSYTFEVYDISTLGNFNAVRGVYVFSKGTRTPVYIGETRNAKDRLTESHPERGCVRRNGATKICFHQMANSTAAQRRVVEKDLVDHYQPACNG